MSRKRLFVPPSSPDLVCPIDRHAPQQKRPDLVLRLAAVGVQLAVQRRNAYALHHGADMFAPAPDGFTFEDANQHSRIGRELQMQFIESLQRLLIGLSCRIRWQYARQRTMPTNRTCRLTGNARSRSIIALRSAFPLCRARFPKNRFPESIDRSSRAMPLPRPRARLMFCPSRTLGQSALAVTSSIRDLVRSHIKLLGQLGPRLVALERRDCHLCLER